MSFLLFSAAGGEGNDDGGGSEGLDIESRLDRSSGMGILCMFSIIQIFTNSPYLTSAYLSSLSWKVRGYQLLGTRLGGGLTVVGLEVVSLEVVRLVVIGSEAVLGYHKNGWVRVRNSLHLHIFHLFLYSH